MSGYGKTPDPEVEDYNSRAQIQPSLVSPTASRASRPSYPQYSSAHYQAQPKLLDTTRLPQTSEDYHSNQFSQVAPSLSVVDVQPREGGENTEISLTVDYSGEVTESSHIEIWFGNCSVRPSTFVPSTTPGQYCFTARAPVFSSTGWSSASVQLAISIEGIKVLGEKFNYLDNASAALEYSPDRPQSRKRKTMEDYDKTTPTKRQTLQDIRPKGDSYGSYYSDMPPPSTTYAYSQAPPSERAYVYSAFDQAGSAGPSPNAPNFQYPSVEVSQAPHLSPIVQQTQGGWAPGYHQRSPATAGMGNIRPRTEGIHMPSISQGPSMALPSPPEVNPQLVRTSTLQTGANRASHAASFNPYAQNMLPSKAVLDIRGDLESVAHNWSAEEWENRRRLVQFWRQQKGNTIHASFQPVSSTDRHSSNTIISCIWWEEKGECYVTSVDCILLLESLISVKFTVEEKNRIRRNLEGFKPLTVSKGKPESENFFKLIMHFPDPKPRNIEKDVKVFPWKILKEALKKIIGKYSASYASTASIIRSPTSAISYGPGAASLIDSNMNRRASLPGPSHTLPSPQGSKPILPALSAAGSIQMPSASSFGQQKSRSEEELMSYSVHSGTLPPPIDAGHAMWHSQSMHPRAPPAVSRASWELPAYTEHIQSGMPSVHHPGQLHPSPHLPDLSTEQNSSLHRHL